MESLERIPGFPENEITIIPSVKFMSFAICIKLYQTDFLPKSYVNALCHSYHTLYKRAQKFSFDRKF